MAGYKTEIHKQVTTPEITVNLLSGSIVWGPRCVDLGQTIGDLAGRIEKPPGCPGVTLLHGTKVLGEDVDISKLPDSTLLTANFLAPPPFDHSFVTELLELGGVMDDEMSPLPSSHLDPSIFAVPGAQVLVAEFQIKDKVIAKYEQVLKTRFMLRLQLSEGSSDVSNLEITMFPDMCSIVLDRDEVQIIELRDTGNIVECHASGAIQPSDLDYYVVWSPIENLIECHKDKRIFEGVSCSSCDVPNVLMEQLNKLIDELKESEPADYHPGSNDIVRDLIHPSLYPFIKGESAIVLDLPSHETKVVEAVTSNQTSKRDMWNRSYEDSKFQWLPSEVSVSSSGECKFQTYINNLPEAKYSALYAALGELLTKCLPHLEAVWNHGASITFLDDEMDVYDLEDAEDGDLCERTLHGLNLQVIVKIVDYEFQSGQAHEGVWHVEGMSHEHIVATAELILQKSPSLRGGKLEFQRAWTTVEAGRFAGLPQCRSRSLDHCIEKGLCPLGRLPLEVGQLTAWPNSHVHKLGRLVNVGDQPAQRRIVVFWLVDPDRRIISSRHVAPQQSSMTLDEAKKNRLELMEERKRHKQDWNVREVSLCEH